MFLRTVDIREIRLRLRHPFVTSLGRIEERRIILVRVEDESGEEGWGECTSDENPFYNEEWVDGSWLMLEDAAHAIELGSCRIINVKLGRVGGYTSALRIERICREAGVPVWCGGMLESGIGRAHNIALSTLQGFSLPGDVSASARYWEQDFIDPPVTVTPEGLIKAPRAVGLGFTVDRERIERFTARKAISSG